MPRLSRKDAVYATRNGNGTYLLVFRIVRLGNRQPDRIPVRLPTSQGRLTTATFISPPKLQTAYYHKLRAQAHSTGIFSHSHHRF